MSIELPERARRDDPNGHMVVQRNLTDFLIPQIDDILKAELFGQAIVPQGATTFAVVHPALPSAHAVVACPHSNPGGNWWLSNATATGFQINLAVAAPIGGVSFQWIGRGAT